MSNVGKLLAALLLVGCAVAFGLRYVDRAIPAAPAPQAPPMPSASAPHYPESLASHVAEDIAGSVVAYHGVHGKLPPAEDFWTAIGVRPIHNPLNGSADVVAMKMDREWDTSGVGWVYDVEGGAVYPGVVFNSGAATRPTTRP
jgi:hypothetical protein